MKKEPPFFSADIQLHHQRTLHSKSTPQAQSFSPSPVFFRPTLFCSFFQLPFSIFFFSILLFVFFFEPYISITPRFPSRIGVLRELFVPWLFNHLILTLFQVCSGFQRYGGTYLPALLPSIHPPQNHFPLPSLGKNYLVPDAFLILLSTPRLNFHLCKGVCLLTKKVRPAQGNFLINARYFRHFFQTVHARFLNRSLNIHNG